MNGGTDETRRYGILVSMLSRGKVEESITPDEALEDSVELCSHQEFHFCPGFSSREEVIATVRSTPYLWYSERGLIHIVEQENRKERFREFSMKSEGRKHFDLVYDACLSLAREFLEKRYKPPLMLPTSRFNTGSLFPLGGKRSVEPDAIVITRDERSESEFGYCSRAAIEAQRSGFEFLYGKLRKYRELNIRGERLFLLIVIPENLSEHLESFRKRAGLMGFVEMVDYQIRIKGRQETSNTATFHQSASMVK